ncbi:MAG: hypothetical protein ACOX5Z_05140 [Desulfobulbus sp.]|jgi:hypothetical protein
MKLLRTFKKLNRLRLKNLSGKGAALFLLNRKIPAMGGGKARFGAITDLHLDRGGKTIAFEITREQEVNTVTVRGYGIAAHKGKSALRWQSMEFAGPSSDVYRQAFHNIDRIDVPRAYVSFLEAVL